MPIIIYRPSVIAGNSISGEISKGALIYEFINQFNAHTYKEFICDDDSSLNIIPIEYLIEAITHISRERSNIGKTFNIVNQKNTNIRSMIEIICRELKVKTPDFIPLEHQDKASKLTKMFLYTFINYIEKSHVFDDSLAAEALNDSNIICPIITNDYFTKTIEYCKSKGFLGILNKRSSL